MTTKSDFLYPRFPYHGEVKPENLVFDANLQEFTHKASYIYNLETNGKLSAEKAYQEIKKLWKELDISGNSQALTRTILQSAIVVAQR